MPYRPFRPGDVVRVIAKCPERIPGEFENSWVGPGCASHNGLKMEDWLPGGPQHDEHLVVSNTNQHGVRFVNRAGNGWGWPPASLMLVRPELAVGDRVRVMRKPDASELASDAYFNMWTPTMDTFLPGGGFHDVYEVLTIGDTGVRLGRTPEHLLAAGDTAPFVNYAFPAGALRVERPTLALTNSVMLIERVPLEAIHELIQARPELAIPALARQLTTLERDRIRRRFKDQVNLGNHSPYRQGRYPAYWAARQIVVKAMRAHGAYLAETINALRKGTLDSSDVDTSELVDALNAIRTRGRPGGTETVLDQLEDAGYDHSYYVGICDDCGAHYDAEDCDSWRDVLGGRRVCEDCAGSSYRYSERMDEYIPESDAHPVYYSVQAWRNEDAGDYTTNDYGRRHLNGNDSVGFFSDVDDWYTAHGEYYGTDDDDDGRDGLRDYHNSSRHFEEQVRTPALGPALGVELEVYAQDSRRGTVREIRESFPDLILERDGSLDEDQGFEIVTQPMGVPEWEDYAKRLLSHLQDCNVVAYNDPAGDGYGIHVNIHRRHFSPLAEARIMMMMCSEENASFVRAVAQREAIYRGDVDIGQYESDNLTVGSLGSLRPRPHPEHAQRKIYGRGKYAPVNWQDNIAEFRIFQSTLSLDSFMKNLEFVWALHAWTKPESATGSSFDHKDFVRWLNTSARRRQYPHLVKYLSRKSFKIKGGRMIVSGWHSLMAKPDEETFVESLAA